MKEEVIFYIHRSCENPELMEALEVLFAWFMKENLLGRNIMNFKFVHEEDGKKSLRFTYDRENGI